MLFDIFFPYFFSSSFHIRSESFIENDSLGCNSVSWAPYSSADEDGTMAIHRIATGSCDNSVRVWVRRVDVDGRTSAWTEEEVTGSPHNGLYGCISNCFYSL